MILQLFLFLRSQMNDPRDSGAPSQDLEDEPELSVAAEENELNDTDDVFEENIPDASISNDQKEENANQQ